MCCHSCCRLGLRLCRERGAPVPPDQSLEAARRIKEHFCYVCAGERSRFVAHCLLASAAARGYVMPPSRQAQTLADSFLMLKPCAEQLAADPAQLTFCRLILLSALASVVADPAKESDKLAADPAKYTRRYEGVGRTGTPFAVDVLRERFLGPELFFQPQLYAGGHSGAWRGDGVAGLGVKYG